MKCKVWLSKNTSCSRHQEKEILFIHVTSDKIHNDKVLQDMVNDITIK